MWQICCFFKNLSKNTIFAPHQMCCFLLFMVFVISLCFFLGRYVFLTRKIVKCSGKVRVKLVHHRITAAFIYHCLFYLYSGVTTYYAEKSISNQDCKGKRWVGGLYSFEKEGENRSILDTTISRNARTKAARIKKRCENKSYWESLSRCSIQNSSGSLLHRSKRKLIRIF